MPTAGLSLQFAQIFWTPSFSLVEYQCAFCFASFLNHDECLEHFKKCPKNHTNIFDKVPEPRRESGEYLAAQENKELVVVKVEADLDINDAEPEPVGDFRIEFVQVLHECVSKDQTSVVANSETPENKHNVLNKLKPCAIPNNSKPRVVLDHQTTASHEAHENMTSATVKTNSKPKNNKPPPIASKRKRIREDDEVAFSKLVCNKRVLICDMCGHKTKTRLGMLYHMTSVHIAMGCTESRFECDICSKIFTRKDKLHGHLGRHTAKFGCEYCGLITSDRGNLNVHLRIHTGEKPYPCKICDKTFTSTTSLQTHMRTHTGEKPYKCTICPKRFTTSSHCKSHINTHTKAISYSCDACDKTFTKPISLAVHKRSHTGERPYECEVCGRTFARSHSYKVHMNTHTGNKPFSCKMCDRSFHSSAARCLHEQNFHKAK